jgi:GTP-dependent phosphoenolpyruvate carboxykinase
MTIREELIQQIEHLSETELEAVKQSIDSVIHHEEPQYDTTVPPVWEIATQIGAEIPQEEWAKVPSDLSKNVDHYLYGSPKTED